MESPTWIEQTVTSSRHETAYLEDGPEDGTVIILSE